MILSAAITDLIWSDNKIIIFLSETFVGRLDIRDLKDKTENKIPFTDLDQP